MTTYAAFGGHFTSTSSGSAVLGDSATEKYTSPLQALLPSGIAWTRELGTNLTAVLRAIGLTFERVERRALRLIEEADPRTTTELLEDWERIAGLPGELVAPPTIAGRRLALTAKLSTRGRVDQGYFVALAAELGYTITIRRYFPFVAGSPVGDSLTQEDWIFVWDVVTASADIDDQLEAIFRANAPDHTLVRFAYE